MAGFPAKACANCSAASVGLRKDGHLKIFQKPLTKKAKDAMRALGLSYDAALRVRRIPDDEDGDESDDGADEDDESNLRKHKFLPQSEVEMQMKLLWDAEPVITRAIWYASLPTPPSALECFGRLFLTKYVVVAFLGCGYQGPQARPVRGTTPHPGRMARVLPACAAGAADTVPSPRHHGRRHV